MPRYAIRYGGADDELRRQILQQKYEDYQASEPIKQALEVAKLQKEQAALEFQGRAQLDAERTQANTLREGAAFYAAKPVLEKYFRDQVAAGHPEFAEGGPAHAEAYANFAAQFPYALRYLPDVAKTVQEHAEVHDLKAKLNQNVAIMNELNLRPGQTAEITGKNEVNVRSAPPLDQQGIQRFARVSGELEGAKALKHAEMERQAKANTDASKPIYNPNDPLAAPIEARIKAAQTELGLLPVPQPAQPVTPVNTTPVAAPAPTAAPVATPAPVTAIPENSQGVPQPQPAATPKPRIVKQGGVTYTLQDDGTYR